MIREGLSHRRNGLGSLAAWTISFLLIAYGVVTALGFVSLQSTDDPIGDPYFTLMELLIVILAPLIVILWGVVYVQARSETKIFALVSLVFMSLMAGITSCGHFVVLTVGRPLMATGEAWAIHTFSFSWPSVVYTLDILAWDWFFPLALLFAVPVFNQGRIEKTIRVFLVVSGVLSLAGLIGVPLGNMQIRNIGIVGYAVVSLGVFICLGVLFHGKELGRVRR